MKNEVFKPRKISKALLCFITGCLLLAFYASYETGQWAIPLPLLPPVFIILVQHRTRYLIWEDGRVEIRSGWGKSKILNELHQVIYYPKNWLNNRIRINYQNTFELLDPERPQEFLKALRRYVPELKIEEKEKTSTMNPKRILWLISILTVLLPHSLQAQEDSLQIERENTRSYLSKELLFRPTGTPTLNTTLPTVPPLPSQQKLAIPLPTQPVLPIMHFNLPKLPLIPYYTNPTPLFKGDFHTDGLLLPHRYGALFASGSQTSVPGIGRFNQASLTYMHRLNDKLSFQLAMDAMKIHMSHLSGQAFSASGMMLYQATDKLGFRVFGSYAPGNTFGMNTHSYGGTLIWQVNDRFGLEMGAQRYYDSMRGGWQTVPVVIPSYRFDHFKLELDVGGLLYEILRNVLYDAKNSYDPRGATIAPPRFSFPAK